MRAKQSNGLRIVCSSAGAKREANLREGQTQMSEEANIKLNLWERNLRRGDEQHGIAEDAVWDKICKDVATARA
eukprot:8285580-Karenia_brevis.AAC.1